MYIPSPNLSTNSRHLHWDGLSVPQVKICETELSVPRNPPIFSFLSQLMEIFDPVDDSSLSSEH